MQLARGRRLLGASIIGALLCTVPTVAVGSAQAMAVAPVSAKSAECRHEFTGSERAELIYLSDPATLRDLHDARDRATRIRALFVKNHDYRGTFAIFYKAVLDGAVPSIDNGDYADREYVTAVSLDFFKRYLENLHGHLTGGPVTPYWQNFYDKTAECNLSPGRVLLAALNAHVIIDLPQAVATAGSSQRNVDDFMKVGDSLQASTSVMFADFKQVYGQDVSGFFGGLIFGDAIDLVVGPGGTQYTVLQSARAYAFANGLELQGFTKTAAFARMHASWLVAEGFVTTSATAGAI